VYFGAIRAGRAASSPRPAPASARSPITVSAARGGSPVMPVSRHPGGRIPAGSPAACWALETVEDSAPALTRKLGSPVRAERRRSGHDPVFFRNAIGVSIHPPNCAAPAATPGRAAGRYRFISEWSVLNLRGGRQSARKIKGLNGPCRKGPGANMRDTLEAQRPQETQRPWRGT
jgi:hypothetical protein